MENSEPLEITCALDSLNDEGAIYTHSLGSVRITRKTFNDCGSPVTVKIVVPYTEERR